MKMRRFPKSDSGILLSSVLLLAISSAWAQNPGPCISGPLFPESLAPGTPFVSTVGGSGFVSASAVEWNGPALPTTFVSSDRLTVNVPDACVALPGTAGETLSNGGVISDVAYEITNPISSASFNQSCAVHQVPHSIAAGDFNGDGKLDLAVTSRNDGTASMLLGNGEAKFKPAVSCAAENGASSVTASDFKGNADLDLPVVNGKDNVMTEPVRAPSSSGQASIGNTDCRESSKAERRIAALMARPVQWYRDEAAQGSLEAVFVLGWLYDHGQGVQQDYRQAGVYYRAAAERGHAVAQNNLAAMYESGHGVAKNLGEAARWYRAAAEQGQPIAQVNLASLFFSGRGVPRDYAQSARWLRAAADQGDAPAEQMLSIAYYYGYGVGVDFAEAAKWARRAADQGDAAAQAELGFLYEAGKGVPLDYVAAYKWYSLAQQAGDKNSRASIQNLLRVMTPTQVSQARKN